MSEGIEIYKAIVAVAGELAKEGIAKDRKCTQGATYNFRGIDDIYNALAPFLAKHSLCILPRMVARDSVERLSKNGGALFYTTVEAEFDFVSAVDGSRHTVRTFGEAMDSGDKGTNKAMSAAYKYAAFQAFCIPTEGDNDTENQTHEVQPRQQQQRQQPRQQQGEKPQLSEAQAKYFPRVKAALDALHGSDIAAKKATIKANTAMPAKGQYPAREGIEDYRTLDGDRLKYFCHAVEKLVPKEICNECRQTGSHADSCPNATPPQ